MKLKLLSIICLFCLLSCQENVESDLESDIIKVTLTGTELYQYTIADAIPVEGGYEIRRQAKNHQVSKMNWGEYQYRAKEGFKGKETVEIVLSGSPGDDNFQDYNKWIFEITVK
jgi:hypothetical protein